MKLQLDIHKHVMRSMSFVASWISVSSSKVCPALHHKAYVGMWLPANSLEISGPGVVSLFTCHPYHYNKHNATNISAIQSITHISLANYICPVFPRNLSNGQIGVQSIVSQLAPRSSLSMEWIKRNRKRELSYFNGNL